MKAKTLVRKQIRTINRLYELNDRNTRLAYIKTIEHLALTDDEKDNEKLYPHTVIRIEMFELNSYDIEGKVVRKKDEVKDIYKVGIINDRPTSTIEEAICERLLTDAFGFYISGLVKLKEDEQP